MSDLEKIESAAIDLPKCGRDCFAAKKGRCSCLIDNDFDGKACPFYKPKSEVNMAEMERQIREYAVAKKRKEMV